MAVQFEHDVFISYSQKDRDGALALEDALKAHGLRVWRDENLIKSPSNGFITTISTALERSAKVLVLWSQRSLQSDWVKAEAEWARMKGRLVALSLDPLSALLPFMAPPFNTLPTIDTTAAAFDVEMVLRALGARPVAGHPAHVRTLVRADVDLSKLPPTFADKLYGRDREMAALVDAWDSGQTRIFAFDAMGGAGKTALAYHFVQALSTSGWRGAQRVFAWSFYSQGSNEDRQTSADDFFAAATHFFSGFTAEPPRDAREKGVFLAGLVQKNRALLILDGLEPLQYATGRAGRTDSGTVGGIKDPGIKALLSLLAEDNPGMCLVTTRLPLSEFKGAAGVRFAPLARLPLMAGLDLIRDLGVEPALTQKLYKLPDRMAFAGMDPQWHPPAEFAVPPGDDRAPMPLSTGRQLIEAVEELDCHALALTLVAKYLAEHHNGDVRAMRELPSLANLDPTDPHRNPYRVMRAIEIALAKRVDEQGKTDKPADVIAGRELALLAFLGLFDRPADTALLPVVFAKTGLLAPDADDLTIAATEYERVADERTLPEMQRRKRETVREARRRILLRRLFAGMHTVSTGDLRAALGDLARRGLVAKIDEDSAWEATAIDCHPLVREYFGTRLEELDLAAFQAAHGRLYDHYRFKGLPESFQEPVAYGLLAVQCALPDYGAARAVETLIAGKMDEQNRANVPKPLLTATPAQLRKAAELIGGAEWDRAVERFQPNDARGMEPLFIAIGHGCAAGREIEAWKLVYHPRVLGDAEAFATQKFGSAAQHLTALSNFFERPFTKPSANLPEDEIGLLANYVSVYLQAMGRQEDALAPMRAAALLATEHGSPGSAAVAFGNIGLLLATLGRLNGEDGAVANCRRALMLEERVSLSQKTIDRGKLASVLLQDGSIGETEALMREAERVQCTDSGQPPLLYTMAGFCLCEALLERGRVEEAGERANATLDIARRHQHLLSIGLDTLTQARAALAAAAATSPTGATPAVDLSAQALSALRRANSEGDLPRALLTHAEALWRAGELAKADAALRECDALCKRGPMPLFLADSALLKARMQLWADRPMRASKYRDEAAALIDKHGYGRRVPDLAILDAEIAAVDGNETLPGKLDAAVVAIRGTPFHDETTRRTIDGGWWGLLPRLEALLVATAPPTAPAARPALAALHAARDAYNAERDAYLAWQERGGADAEPAAVTPTVADATPDVPDDLLDEILADAEMRGQLDAMLRDAGIDEPLESLPRESQREAVAALLAAMRDTPEAAPADDTDTDGAEPALTSAPTPAVTDAVVACVFSDPDAQDILRQVMRDAELAGAPADLPLDTQRRIVELLVEDGVIQVGRPAEAPAASAAELPPAALSPCEMPGAAAGVKTIPASQPPSWSRSGWKKWWPFARKA